MINLINLKAPEQSGAFFIAKNAHILNHLDPIGYHSVHYRNAVKYV